MVGRLCSVSAPEVHTLRQQRITGSNDTLSQTGRDTLHTDTWPGRIAFLVGLAAFAIHILKEKP